MALTASRTVHALALSPPIARSRTKLDTPSTRTALSLQTHHTHTPKHQKHVGSTRPALALSPVVLPTSSLLSRQKISSPLAAAGSTRPQTYRFATPPLPCCNQLVCRESSCMRTKDACILLSRRGSFTRFRSALRPGGSTGPPPASTSVWTVALAPRRTQDCTSCSSCPAASSSHR